MELTDDLRGWLAVAPFRFVKTTPENPHFYVTERDERERGFEVELTAFVGHLREQGESRRYKGYAYRTIAIDGFDYWLTAGRDCGAIVNRKPSAEAAGWDDMTGWQPGDD